MKRSRIVALGLVLLLFGGTSLGQLSEEALALQRKALGGEPPQELARALRARAPALPHDLGNASGTVTCTIPYLGAVTVQTLDLERGTAHGCVGAWGDGKGKWTVLTRSDELHFATSALQSVELGILANISDALTLRFEYD